MSVIIPTFNRAGFLERAVRSVLRQNVAPLEILIIDDGSTDDTRQVVERFQRGCDKIRYLMNSRTKGPSGARNTGITNASGRYLAFLDSDDEWLPGHIPVALKIFEENPGLSALFGNFRVVEARSGRTVCDFFDKKPVLSSLKTATAGDGVWTVCDDLFSALARENFFHLGGAVIRRESLGGILFNERVRYGEDKDLAIRLFQERDAVFAFRRQPVFVLYRHSGSLTADGGPAETGAEMVRARILLYEGYLRSYDLTAPQRTLIRQLLSEAFVNLAYLHRLRGEYGQAARSVIRSMGYSLSYAQMEESAKILHQRIVG